MQKKVHQTRNLVDFEEEEKREMTSFEQKYNRITLEED